MLDQFLRQFTNIRIKKNENENCKSIKSIKSIKSMNKKKAKNSKNYFNE